MKRSPLRRYTALKSKPSKRKRKMLDQDLRERVMLRDRGCVAVRLVPEVDCWGDWHCHHIQRRSQGGPDTAENLVTLCAAHHGWVHANPQRASTLGLLRLRS